MDSAALEKMNKSLYPNIPQGHRKVVFNALVTRQRLSFKSNSINQSIWSVHMTPRPHPLCMHQCGLAM